MFKFFLTGFEFDNKYEYNEFVRYCIDLVESYIEVLVSRGKIFLPFELSAYDAAVDLTAELYNYENNKLIRFQDYFSRLSPSPKSHTEFENELKAFLFTIAASNLISLFSKADPHTAKIIRKINEEVKSGNYNTSIFLSDKYFHREKIDFSDKDYCPRDALTDMVIANGIVFSSFNRMFDDLFNMIDAQNTFLKAISFNDLIYITKFLMLNNFKRENSTDETNSSLNLKFLCEDVMNRFSPKLNKYYSRKKFSESEKICMYNIIDDYMRNLLNGGIKQSPSKLTKQYYSGPDYCRFRNKAEYCLQLLNDDIIKSINDSKIE